MSEFGRVSVIIPNFNYARFLERRVQSVLEQTYKDLDVTYLDDCSTDDSAGVIREFMPDTRFRIIENSVNSGSPFIQINRGVRASRGKYVWVAEADDYADSMFLETMVPILERNPSVGLAYCQSLAVDEDGKTLFSMEEHTNWLSRTHWSDDFVANGQEEVRKFLLFSNTIPNFSAVLFRRDVFERAGYAEENMRLVGDWKTWIRMLMLSDVAFVAQPLNYYRWHPMTVRKTLRYADNVRERYQLYYWVAQNVPVSERDMDVVFSKLMKEWLRRIGRRKWRRNALDVGHVFSAAYHNDRKFMKRFFWLLADKVTFGLTRKLRRTLGIQIIGKLDRRAQGRVPRELEDR